jgi:hypothetical protein
MSVAASVLRQTASGVKEIAGRSSAGPSLARNFWQEPLFSLVRELFFPAGAPARKSLLLVAADATSRPEALCRQLGATLSKVSGENVAVVQPLSIAELEPNGPIAMSEGVWRIAPDSFFREFEGPNAWGQPSPKELGSFKHFLFSASSSDAELSALCGLCDAAVLVVTANVTRRQAALCTREMLCRHRVELIGAILDRRTLPIPESIYRKL